MFTPLDAGTKIVHVCLHPTGESAVRIDRTADENAAHVESQLEADTKADESTIDFTFSISVPGIAADYLRRDFEALQPAASRVECDIKTLIERLSAMASATTNAKGTRWAIRSIWS